MHNGDLDAMKQIVKFVYAMYAKGQSLYQYVNNIPPYWVQCSAPDKDPFPGVLKKYGLV